MLVELRGNFRYLQRLVEVALLLIDSDQVLHRRDQEKLPLVLHLHDVGMGLDEADIEPAEPLDFCKYPRLLLAKSPQFRAASLYGEVIIEEFSRKLKGFIELT